jgi:membrane protease YdiL (CAAX protease family)
VTAESSAQSAPGYKRPLAIVLGTTACVTALSYLMPENYAATSVGLAFLVVTYFLVLRKDDSDEIRRAGLSFAGLLEPARIDFKRVLRETLTASGWALLVSLLIFPAFWVGFVIWWNPRAPFSPAPAPSFTEEVLGQLTVIALPEEAFYRGYLQSSLDEAWRPRWRVLGAYVGPALLVTSALFAAGHFLTEMHPNRLAVFFPALLFGWLRARTGGVGAPIVLHALCNLFASWLAQSFGLG